MQAIRVTVASSILITSVIVTAAVAKEGVPAIPNRVSVDQKMQNKVDIQQGVPAQSPRSGDAVGIPSDEVTFPPQIQVGPKLSPMNAKEKRALKLSKARIKEKLMPTAGADGSVVYMYGHSEPFTVCAPGRWCAIRLAPGEVISGGDGGIVLTDSVNWWAKPIAYGSRRQIVTDVMVSPKYPGTQAQIAFGTNQGRRYVIGLRSTNSEYVHSISFAYPDDEVRTAEAEYQRQIAQYDGGGIASDVNIASLDFEYEISGDHEVRPTAVYTDGKRTVIEFGREMPEMPVVVGLGDDGNWFSGPSRYVLNVTTLSKSRLLVDAPLVRAAIVSGVGSDGKEALIERRR